MLKFITKYERRKKVTPRATAMITMITTNLSISLFNGVFGFVSACARLATYPIVVLSPVYMTMPLPYPD